MNTVNENYNDPENNNHSELEACRADFEEFQPLIDNGQVWHLEGRWGRMAMKGIQLGLFHLGPDPCEDAYGNRVPAHHEIKPGFPGSMEYCERFWRDKLQAEMPC